MTEDERIVVAGEYVLGTLAPAERAAFGARIAAERASADAVRFWERALASLAGTVADLAPPPRVWTAIAARIGARPTANDRGGTRWRTAALASAGVAAALAAVIIAAPRREAVTPGPATPPSVAVAPTPAVHGQYIAALNAKGRESALLLTLDPVTGAVVAHPVKLSAPARRNLELWWIAAGAAPRAVGLLDPAQPLRGRVVDAKLDGGAFAISVEPIGGSTTGAPTGPVVYSGAVVRTAS